MDAFASLSREELIPLVQQQAELNLFLQQEILTLRAEIHRLKGGGNAPPPKPECSNIAARSASLPSESMDSCKVDSSSLLPPGSQLMIGFLVNNEFKKRDSCEKCMRVHGSKNW